jgi:hypothetical protein
MPCAVTLRLDPAVALRVEALRRRLPRRWAAARFRNRPNIRRISPSRSARTGRRRTICASGAPRPPRTGTRYRSTSPDSGGFRGDTGFLDRAGRDRDLAGARRRPARGAASCALASAPPSQRLGAACHAAPGRARAAPGADDRAACIPLGRADRRHGRPRRTGVLPVADGAVEHSAARRRAGAALTGPAGRREIAVKA